MTRSTKGGRPAHGDVLTPGEWQVAEAVRHGLTNKAIAERQGVSLDAVKYHVSNVLTKLGLSSRRELRLWTGIRRDSALPQKSLPLGDALALGEIGQIARSVTNLAEAVAWYKDTLGLPLLYVFETLAFFDCGGLRLMLSQSDDSKDSILYFRVGAIHAAHETLAARGVTFVSAPHMIHRHDDGTEEWMAFFTDNEGRPLGLMSQMPGNTKKGTE